MKKIINWQVSIGIILIILSLAAIAVHFSIFHDVKFLESFVITSLAYIFIEVFVVILVIQGLLEYREKKAMFKKLNMLIGTFYSEAGTALLKLFSRFDTNSELIAKKLVVSGDWKPDNFSQVEAAVGGYSPKIVYASGNMAELKRFLITRRAHFLNLLANPNLLEHETFTDLLWAIFHLTEELAAIEDLENLPQSDHEHIINDINRAYKLMLREWVSYMKHLKKDYPFLFSFAMRTNPFDPHACVEVLVK